MQSELVIARNIQQGIMPEKSLSGPFRSAVYFAPLETVSGDYYDFFSLPNGSTGILITDASGHGVPAALITIMAKVYFSAAAAKNLGAGQTLAEVNAHVSQVIVTSHFLTGFYIIIHPDLTAEFACGSHPPCCRC
jgi:sigma-B regulation protein RsbU (phosphoserine phosphatase)